MSGSKASERAGPVVNNQTVKSGQKSPLSGVEVSSHGRPDYTRTRQIL